MAVLSRALVWEHGSVRTSGSRYPPFQAGKLRAIFGAFDLSGRETPKVSCAQKGIGIPTLFLLCYMTSLADLTVKCLFVSPLCITCYQIQTQGHVLPGLTQPPFSPYLILLCGENFLFGGDLATTGKRSVGITRALGHLVVLLN